MSLIGTEEAASPPTTGRRRWRRSRTSEVLVVLVAIVLIILLLGLAMFDRQRDRMTVDALERLDAVVTVQKARIEADLSENLNVDLPGLLSRPGLTGSIDEIGESRDPDVLRLVTDELASALNPAFADLLVITSAGTVIASTDETRLGHNLPDPTLVAAAALSSTEGALSINSRGEVIHTVAAPVTGADGTVHILVLESNEDSLARLAADYTGLGATGETVLGTMNETGRPIFVVPLRFDPDAEFHREVIRSDTAIPMTQALQGVESVLADTRDYRGERVVSATGFVPEAGLGLVVKMDRSEAFSTIDELRQDLRLAFAIFVSLMAFIALGAIRMLRRRDAMARMSRVFEESADPMIVESPDGTILDVNDETVRAYGWSRQELVGQPVKKLISPGSHALSDEIRALHRAGGAGGVHEWNRQTKSGAKIPVSLTLASLKDSNERQIGTVSVARDMSEINAARADMLEARLLAESANLAKSEFLSRMSHEFRTPLNSVIGFSQILEMDLAGQPEIESVAYIRAGGEHLLRMVDDILSLSRIDSGTMTQSTTRVGLRSLASECLGLVRPQISERQIEVVVEPGAEQFVVADRHRLRQVLLNLLSNAIKFNHDGGTITIGTAAGDQTARFLIADTGRGIAPEHVDDLFKPFERLGAEAMGIEGTGLGLALSRGLIQAMGGTMGAESVPDQGSTFWFDLPIDETKSGPDVSASSGTVSDPSANPEGSMLYIDHDTESARLVERIVKRLPRMKLTIASKGTSGLQHAREDHVDIILVGSDLADMPAMSVLGSLRADPLTTNIPVVVVSTEIGENQARRIRAAGAFGHLVKPIDAGELFDLINRFVGPAAQFADR